MHPRRGPARFRRALAIIAFGSALSFDVRADGPRVRVGEVTARGARADARVTRELRALLVREIGRLTTGSVRREGDYVLAASLVRVDARASAEAARATCVVSATLRHARSGVLVAMMHGQGAAEDEPGALDEAVSHALEAAVHGAVARVPEAL